MRLTIAYILKKKRNVVLINNDTYQRETVSERPIRQPLIFLAPFSRYDNEGCHQEAQSISSGGGSGGGGGTNWLTLADVRNQNLGQGEKVSETGFPQNNKNSCFIELYAIVSVVKS